MPVPIIAGAAAAGKSAAVASALGNAGDWLGKQFGSQDSARKERAAKMTAAALAGDQAALAQMAFDAFEPTRGLPGDHRRPVDGTRSPPLVRELARKGLGAYVTKYGGLPPTLAKYAEQMSVPIQTGPTPWLQQVLTPTINTITDTAIDRAAERTQSTVQRYMPLIIGGAAVLVLVLYMANRKK